MVQRYLAPVVAWSVGIGVGLGLAMAGALVAANPRRNLTDEQVMQRARVLGMLDLTDRLAVPGSDRIAFAIGPHTEFAELGAMLEAAGVLKAGATLAARAHQRGRLGRLRPGIYVLAVDPRLPQENLLDEVIDRVTPSGM